MSAIWRSCLFAAAVLFISLLATMTLAPPVLAEEEDLVPVIEDFSPPADEANQLIDPDNPPVLDLSEQDIGSPVPAPIAGVASKLPESVNLSGLAESAGNQGKVKSCSGWAFGHGLTGWWARRYGRKPRLNATPTQIFGKGTVANYWLNPMSIYAPVVKGRNKGAELGDVAAFASAWGTAPSYRYSVGQFGYDHQPTSSERSAASRFRLKGIRRLFNAYPKGSGSGGIQRIKKELANGRPVVIGMAVNTRKLTHYRGGIYDQDSCGSSRCGGHAMLAVGYSKKGLLLQNSWGYWWGGSIRRGDKEDSGGFGMISWSTVSRYVFEAWRATGLR